jgi:predicted membrane protein
MRGLGMVLLTGAAAVILWKIIAAMLVGILGMVLKVVLVFAVVYFLIQIFQGRKKDE